MYVVRLILLIIKRHHTASYVACRQTLLGTHLINSFATENFSWCFGSVKNHSLSCVAHENSPLCCLWDAVWPTLKGKREKLLKIFHIHEVCSSERKVEIYNNAWSFITLNLYFFVLGKGWWRMGWLEVLRAWRFSLTRRRSRIDCKKYFLNFF